MLPFVILLSGSFTHLPHSNSSTGRETWRNPFFKLYNIVTTLLFPEVVSELSIQAQTVRNDIKDSIRHQLFDFGGANFRSYIFFKKVKKYLTEHLIVCSVRNKSIFCRSLMNLCCLCLEEVYMLHKIWKLFLKIQCFVDRFTMTGLSTWCCMCTCLCVMICGPVLLSSDKRPS